MKRSIRYHEREITKKKLSRTWKKSRIEDEILDFLQSSGWGGGGRDGSLSILHYAEISESKTLISISAKTLVNCHTLFNLKWENLLQLLFH